MRKKYLFLIILVSSLAFNSYSQDVTTFFKRFKKKPEISGGLSVNQVLYGVSGKKSHRAPYSYYFSGNLNFTIFDWGVPFSFSYSSQQLHYQLPFQQPFNQFGITPYYKWVKLYAGYSSMSFSPYTMNGYRFLGGGIELTPPGIFKFSAMYGRLNKAIEADTSQSIPPTFERMGYACKISLEGKKAFAHLNIFGAHDDPSSVPIPENTEITPGENLAFSINAGTNILNRINLQAEFASSAYTKDIRTEQLDEKAPGIYTLTDGLLENRLSTNYYNAIKSNANYTGKGYSIGLGYERVQPGYKTMGAYYFNNDFENITINTAFQLAKGRINFSSNIGRQKNNLDNSKMSTTKRWVSAFNLNLILSRKWSIACSYTNFNTFTNIRSNFEKINEINPYENIDTLNFTQLSQNATFNTFYIIGKPNAKDRNQNIGVNLSYQVAASQQGQKSVEKGSKFINVNAFHSLNLVPIKFTLTSSVNMNFTSGQDINTFIIGPNIALNKTFFKEQLRTTMATAWNRSYAEGKAINRIFNLRISSTYTLKEKHNIVFSAIMLSRRVFNPKLNSNEFTGTLTYSFSF